MNLRCIYCQTPFTLSRSEMLGAIINMNEKNQNHYDAHCPKCRRANSISRQRMELFFPNWREAAKQRVEPVAASASLKTDPLPKAKKAEASKTAAKKTPAAKKPAAKKTTSVKTTANKSPSKSKKK